MHDLVAPWRELVDEAVLGMVERVLDGTLGHGNTQVEVLVVAAAPGSPPSALAAILTKITHWAAGWESIANVDEDRLVLVRSVASTTDFRNGRRFLRAVAHCSGFSVRAGLASTPTDGMTADVLVSTALRRVECKCLDSARADVAARVCESDCDILGSAPLPQPEAALRGASGF